MVARRLSTSPAPWKILYKYYINEYLILPRGIERLVSLPLKERVKNMRPICWDICACPRWIFFWFLLKIKQPQRILLARVSLEEDARKKVARLGRLESSDMALRREMSWDSHKLERNMASGWRGTGSRVSAFRGKMKSPSSAKKAFITNRLILRWVVGIGFPAWLWGL